MVSGIDMFKDFFADYKEQYVLIGGVACDIILEDSDEEFRATKDLDLVLIVEALTPEFGKAFWQFIVDGGYRNKSNIVRLATILIGTETVELPQEVHNDMEEFITRYQEAPVDLKSLRIAGVTNEQIVERLRDIYL